MTLIFIEKSLFEVIQKFLACYNPEDYGDYNLFSYSPFISQPATSYAIRYSNYDYGDNLILVPHHELEMMRINGAIKLAQYLGKKVLNICNLHNNE